MVATAIPNQIATPERAKVVSRQRTPLKLTEQRAHLAKLTESLMFAGEKMREQVSRPAPVLVDGVPSENPADYRQEVRAAAGVLAKIASGLDTVLDRLRIVNGKSLPPSLHTEPIKKQARQAKPKNAPPPRLAPPEVKQAA